MTMATRVSTMYRQVYYLPACETPPTGAFYFQVTTRSPLRGPFKTRLEALADAYFWSNLDRKVYPEEARR